MNTQVFLSGFINEILISVDAQQNTNKYIDMIVTLHHRKIVEEIRMSLE